MKRQMDRLRVTRNRVSPEQLRHVYKVDHPPLLEVSLSAVVPFIRSDKPYICSVFAIVIAWVAGIAICYGLVGTGVLTASDELLAIAGIGSGVVAVAGGMPGVLTELLPSSAASPGRITVGFSAGVLIRLFGTVALVGLCSYHLPAAKKEIAGMILAWYVYLTTVDVTVLAMLLPRQDQPAVTRS